MNLPTEQGIPEVIEGKTLAAAPTISEVVSDPKGSGFATAQPVEVKVEAPVEPDAKTETEVPAKDSQSWKDDRIRVLTAKLNDERQKNKGLAPQPTTEAPPVAPVLDEAEFNRRVEAEASRRTSQRLFDQRCDQVAEQGRLAYPDFDSSVQGLVSTINQQDPAEIASYNAFVQAALETGSAAQLIYGLGRDQAEAKRIMSLPPVKMAVELTKIASRPVEVLSGTPKPISPVGGRGPQHTQIDPTDKDRADQLGTEEWMRRRQAQVDASTRH